MEKEKVLDQMCDRNHLGDKSVCLGGFTVDYSKSKDKFFLTNSVGTVREIDLATAERLVVPKND